MIGQLEQEYAVVVLCDRLGAVYLFWLNGLLGGFGLMGCSQGHQGLVVVFV